jgi:hypothetical protein
MPARIPDDVRCACGGERAPGRKACRACRAMEERERRERVNKRDRTEVAANLAAAEGVVVSQRCNACMAALPLDAFHVSPARKPWGRSPKCRSCTAAYDQVASARRDYTTESRKQQRRRPRAQRRIRSSLLVATYGIDADEYDRMCAAQGGVCGICGRESAGGRRLAVDHCHATGVVRELLCGACNTGLGKAEDRVVVLRAAVEYLRVRGGDGE